MRGGGDSVPLGRRMGEELLAARGVELSYAPKVVPSGDLNAQFALSCRRYASPGADS
jgi:hypothetical protein